METPQTTMSLNHVIQLVHQLMSSLNIAIQHIEELKMGMQNIQISSSFTTASLKLVELVVYSTNVSTKTNETNTANNNSLIFKGVFEGIVKHNTPPLDPQPSNKRKHLAEKMDPIQPPVILPLFCNDGENGINKMSDSMPPMMTDNSVCYTKPLFPKE